MAGKEKNELANAFYKTII